MAFRVSGCDQPKFAVKYSKQGRYISGSVLAAGHGDQFFVRSHVAFDVGTKFRQQRLQDGCLRDRSRRG